jgi:hypothetical protein
MFIGTDKWNLELWRRGKEWYSVEAFRPHTPLLLVYVEVFRPHTPLLLVYVEAERH